MWEMTVHKDVRELFPAYVNMSSISVPTDGIVDFALRRRTYCFVFARRGDVNSVTGVDILINPEFT